MDKLINTYYNEENKKYEHYVDDNGKEYLLTYNDKTRMKVKITFTESETGFNKFADTIIQSLQI